MKLTRPRIVPSGTSTSQPQGWFSLFHVLLFYLPFFTGVEVRVRRPHEGHRKTITVRDSYERSRSLGNTSGETEGL